MKRKKWLILLVIGLLLPHAVAIAATESTTDSLSNEETVQTIPSLSEDPLSTISSSETTSTSETISEEIVEDEIVEEETIESADSLEDSELIDEAEENDEEPADKVAAQELAEGEIEVGDWRSFVDGVRNEDVTKITLTNSFDNPSDTDTQLSNYRRSNDLEIDGRGYRIDFKSTSIRLAAPRNETGMFHMHDIVLNQSYGGSNSEDIVGPRGSTAIGGQWRYRFGNITTEPGVQRIARATHGEVTVYGTMNIDTRAENFYLGSFIMEDNTVYNGNVNHYNFSVFWYNVVPAANSTGASQEYTIGKNCHVNATQTQTTGTTYPAVYHHYQRLTVGENSVFNVNMPGNAVRFNDDGSGMIVKSGAVVNLTSKQNSGAVVAFYGNNCYLNVEPDAYFYVIGRSTQPLINMASNSNGSGSATKQNNVMVLDSPAQYDLRNLNDGNPAVQVARNSQTVNSFKIIDSDIDLWNLSTQPLGPSDETYAKVDSLEVTGNNNGQNVITTEPGLEGFNQNSYRRISGMNQNPTIEWVPATDADKSIQARVVIGMVPDNDGLNSEGTINYIPVYASKDQAQVTMVDSFGDIIPDLLTDENGYATYQGEKFQQTGEELSGTAQRGPWVSEESVKTTVVDITPPEPAEINNATKIESNTSKLSGTGEAGSLVTLTINGQAVSGLSSTVEDDGSWELDVSSLSLKQDDVLQLFLQDQSGLADTIEDSPHTNNEIGNIQPAEDLNYRDATFKAASTATVVGYLSLREVPEQLNFGLKNISNKTETYQPQVKGKLEISDSRSDARKPWRLTLSQSEAIKMDTISLSDGLYYSNQQDELQINHENQVVETGEFTEDGIKDISADWQTTGGFKLVVPPEKQRVGTYSGKLAWKLEDVPGN